MHRPQRYILLITALLCALCTAQAQRRRVQNKPFIDERRFHYGFFIGLHDQGLRLDNNGYIDPQTGDQWVAAADRQSFGFSVGVLGEWKMSNHVGLRVIPSLHFGSKHIAFRNLSNGKEESQDMKSCYIGVPVDFKFSGQRFNNFRPYVIAGVQPMYDLVSNKQTKLRTKPFNFMLETGLGCDLYMPFFKFIPELKFCFGLGNMLNKNRTDLTDPTQLIFTQSIARAAVGMFVLTFYFE